MKTKAELIFLFKNSLMPFFVLCLPCVRNAMLTVGHMYLCNVLYAVMWRSPFDKQYLWHVTLAT